MAQVIKIKRGTTTEINLASLEENEIIFNTSTNQLAVIRSGSPKYMATASHTHSVADISGTLTVAKGGTGRTSHTANQVIIGGTTTTGAQRSVAGGPSGYVLTSNGTTAAPSWKVLPLPSLNELEFIGSGYSAYDGSAPLGIYAGDGIDIISLSSGNVEIKAVSKVIRTRAKTTTLTSVNSGDTVGSIALTESITQGTRLMIEVAPTSSATYNPKIVTVTVGRGTTSPNSTTEYYICSFQVFNGTRMKTYSFTLGFSGSTLYFGSKKYIQGEFSGSTIAWTTGIYTLYVGQIWKLED